MVGMHPAWLALTGTGFTFLCTAVGAAMVFLFRGGVKANLQRIFLGFAAGVMIAASVWSLLIPSIEMAEEQGTIGWIPAAGGFVSVSYTHLDVYKRQGVDRPKNCVKTKLMTNNISSGDSTLQNIPNTVRLYFFLKSLFTSSSKRN